MMNILDPTFADWSRVGAMFTIDAAEETPDLELLIARTAQQCSQASRLFIMGVTWLSVYGELVAKHRMVRLSRSLSHEHQAALGLMFELAQQHSQSARFSIITRGLARLSPAKPLFAVEQSSPGLATRARERSMALAEAWGVWCEPFALKLDALRPSAWIFRNNPSFIPRADFQGDLRASILAALLHDPSSGESEMHVARCAGGSRAQVRAALANLELTGKVRCERGGKRTRIIAA